MFKTLPRQKYPAVSFEKGWGYEVIQDIGGGRRVATSSTCKHKSPSEPTRKLIMMVKPPLYSIFLKDG
jgi:hypothetical protein